MRPGPARADAGLFGATPKVTWSRATRGLRGPSPSPARCRRRPPGPPHLQEAHVSRCGLRPAWLRMARRTIAIADVRVSLAVGAVTTGRSARSRWAVSGACARAADRIADRPMGARRSESDEPWRRRRRPPLPGIERVPPPTGSLTGTWTRVGRRTENLTLGVQGFQAGTQITLRCIGPSCPKGTKRARVRNSRKSVNLHVLVGGRSLAKGARIEVRLTAANLSAGCCATGSRRLASPTWRSCPSRRVSDTRTSSRVARSARHKRGQVCQHHRLSQRGACWASAMCHHVGLDRARSVASSRLGWTHNRRARP
jgi:hypothetical protein